MIAASIPEVLMFTGTELSLAREKEDESMTPFPPSMRDLPTIP